MKIKKTVQVGSREFSIEIGKMAKQAHGSAVVGYADTVVLITAVAAYTPVEKQDFLPLTVEYQERFYGAGRIPGGYFKREGRPSEKEILSSRLIDRPIRPLIPKGFNYETQIIASVISADQENDPDIIAITGASSALMFSDIPFAGPIAAVEVGRINGELIINPTPAQLLNSDLDIIVAGSRDAVVMVEGGARIVPEEDVLKAIFFGHKMMQPMIDLQESIAKELNLTKRTYIDNSISDELYKIVQERYTDVLKDSLTTKVKQERQAKQRELFKKADEEFATDGKYEPVEVEMAIEKLQSTIARDMIVNGQKRIDGRKLDEVRPITCEVSVLPRTHGSALFTRGETQALVVTTIGTFDDVQFIDEIGGENKKRFMLHYNFPPFSVGEVKQLRGPGRREIGHGALAERAIAPIIPFEDDFPYTIRIVSDILESNGSSSMATVCGATLSLMDGGVPIKSPVAGVAMGLIKESDNYFILTDILGDEDHLGDMDFKVAGTKEGVTSIQMDIKIKGVTESIMQDALKKARTARLHILDIMMQTISIPRADISEYAPRIVHMNIRNARIKDLIGPGGKNIKAIIEKTKVKIDVDDSGKVRIASNDTAMMAEALKMVKGLTTDAEIGQTYVGKVKKVVDFGAFVELFPGVEGLVHISQLADHKVKRVEDIAREGDEITVKVIDIDREGKIRLSRKEALKNTTNESEQE
ncbi:MAG: polyribonucleotide nucleotidyltransferase [Deltaproteobacteria bacterium]|nr:polyribonucleotide nucleotidyltransferase [Deltaproteobacteria bacterium]MCL5792989.1 polyribonucleotide nucleotidyltransferase [Deltaproteobacteria bacterium]